MDWEMLSTVPGFMHMEMVMVCDLDSVKKDPLEYPMDLLYWIAMFVQLAMDEGSRASWTAFRSRKPGFLDTSCIWRPADKTGVKP